MKNIKSNKLIFTLICILSFVFTKDIKAQEIIESSNLNAFYDSNTNQRTGWPINGCKEFNVTVTTGIGIEVEFTIVNCCVNGSCASQSVLNVIDGIFGNKGSNVDIKKIQEITITESSSTLIGNYSVKIKNGNYKLNKSGGVDNLIYIGTKTKK